MQPAELQLNQVVVQSGHLVVGPAGGFRACRMKQVGPFYTRPALPGPESDQEVRRLQPLVEKGSRRRGTGSREHCFSSHVTPHQHRVFSN